MKIQNMQINAFGNIENKQIELSEGINVIQGKNEAGKSTLLKFIVDMLYGISKNKRGKDFSDYDRYKPWKSEEFSGKITYALDNGKKYEVFRDFNKKNPTIYDVELNDITKDFTIDKTNGNQFFIEQTGIDESTFLSTLASLQQEVRLEKQDQNVLVQKIANIAGSGEDNVSYKKAVEKINKRQLEEIGTARSQGRPLNIIREEKFKLQDEIGELEEYKDKQYELDKLNKDLEQNAIEYEKKYKLLKELKEVEEAENIQKQKIEFNKNIINNNNSKIEKLKLEKQELQKEQVKEKIEIIQEKSVNKNKHKYIVSAVIMLICLIIGIILRNNKMALIGSIALFLITLLIQAYSIVKYKKKISYKEKKILEEINRQNAEKQEVENKITEIDSQIKLLENTNEEQMEEIEIQNNKIRFESEDKKQKILEKYDSEHIDYKNISYELDKIQENINNTQLQIHQLELDKSNILPKLEKLAQTEESLEDLNKREEELLRDNDAIELAKQVLEVAYRKMKETVTPKFTENLSKNIEQISNGKYKNVSINDEEGIIVEKDNGEYISCEKLSVGTIDQLYMSLRFGAIKELSQETMPIILDEAFAYYDDERLENILKYINNEFKNNQVIIFTCTKREEEIMNKLSLKYNMVKL